MRVGRRQIRIPDSAFPMPKVGSWTFTIPGHAVGYYTAGARPNWTRLKAYRAYRDLVMAIARNVGLRLPLRATEEQPVLVHTYLFAGSRVHHDPENVRKGIVDALFYRAKGGDKHVGGTCAPAIYGKGDSVEVVIYIYPKGAR